MNDANTVLVYIQQRYYDPIAGRFMSVDPVVTNANTGKGFGLYTYVENNPYTKVDPDGMDDEPSTGSHIKGGTCEINCVSSGGSGGAGQGVKKTQPKNAEGIQNSGGQKLNIDKMVKSMDANAKGVDGYDGKCAGVCHQGMAAGGIGWDKDRPSAAGKNGPWLVEHGVSVVGHSDSSTMPDNYTPTRGDIAVFSGGANHPIGHMQIYDGEHWVSDTTQTTFSPSHHYPGYVSVYRFPQQ